MRDKWDVVHHATGETYGQASITKAIAFCRETYNGKKPSGKGSTAKAKAQPGRSEQADQGDQGTGLNPYRGTDDANADSLLSFTGRIFTTARRGINGCCGLVRTGRLIPAWTLIGCRRMSCLSLRERAIEKT